MPISNIPGVGPTNADIATAVAAPSAATIAAAVAAPSAATIATAVAAAVPTISAINTSVANNAPSPNAWVHLGTASMNNVNTATISFTAYRKLKVVIKGMGNASTSSTPALRFNGDSGNNYNSGFLYFRSGGTSPSTGLDVSNIGSYRLWRWTGSGLGNGTTFTGTIEIENASLTNIKNYSHKMAYFDAGDGAIAMIETVGSYQGTSAITSVTFFDFNGNAFASNTTNNIAFQVFGMN